VVLGSALAMNRLGEEIGGRIGLIYVDGHADFRHPGNAAVWARRPVRHWPW
jgi:arginase